MSSCPFEALPGMTLKPAVKPLNVGVMYEIFVDMLSTREYAELYAEKP